MDSGILNLLMKTSMKSHRELFLRDDNGVRVYAGDKVRFNFGIPPIGVVAKVIARGNSLIALTPKHTPKECNLRTLRSYVGEWYKY